MGEYIFFVALFVVFGIPLIIAILSYVIYLLENKGYVKMDEEDRLAREIYLKLDLIDPENISKDQDKNYVVQLNSMTVLKTGWEGEKCIYVNDNKLNSSKYRTEDIIDRASRIYYEESERKRIQEISTDLGF